MNRHFFILLSLVLSFPAWAQTGTQVAQNIKGKVINEITNEVVPYTNIGIEGTFYGTASDAEGNFELKIPEEMVSKKIYFSALSFKNDTFPVSSLFDREFVIIKLEPQSYDIENVDIAAQSRVFLRILRMASENTPYNFLGGPFNLACTFENEKIINDTTTVSEKARVMIFDRNGYRQPSKTDAFKMRTYEMNKQNPDYSFATGTTNFDELLGLDWVRSATSVLNPAIVNQFDLALEDETEFNGNPSWVISFSQKEPTLAGSQDFHATYFEGKITISKNDYSVKKIVGSAVSEKHNRQGKSLAVGNSNTNFYEDVSYSFEITYAKLVPQEISLNKNYTFKGQKTEESSRITVEQVQTTNVKEITSRDYFAE
jgi:hypothetical protein